MKFFTNLINHRISPMEIVGFQRDAEDGFIQVLVKHESIVFKIANTYAQGREDKDDLVQEIAAQLWRAWPSYDPVLATTSTWIYRIALNVAISYVRCNGRRKRYEGGNIEETIQEIADPNQIDHEKEQQLRRLQQFIAKQAPLDRALLLLYLEDRSQKEIADILGISESNVSTKIGRLKQRIRQEL